MTTNFGAIVKSSLALLGDEPNEIANNLFILGHTGHLKNCVECPIANYLMSVGLPIHTGVGGMKVLSKLIRQTSDYYRPSTTVCPLEEHHSMFIKNFDRGAYPFLVRRRYAN